MRIAMVFLTLLLLLLPAAAFAQNYGETRVTVYVPSPPEVSVKVAGNSSGLICSWIITDADDGDNFKAAASWYMDGKPVDGLSAEVDGCVAGTSCYSPVFAPAKENEDWTCTVEVKDSYNLKGKAETSYSMVSLGFFGDFSQGLVDFVCKFLHFC